MIEISPKELNENVFSLISKDWMLITGGDRASFNSMTASWGALGHIWGRDAAFVFVRPTRHTYKFMEANENFTLSFFDEEYRPALNLFGKKSGRDTDKAAEAGLTPEGGEFVWYAEARLVIKCKKLYYSDISKQGMAEAKLDSFYSGDYHRMYVGEIVGCMKR